MEPITIATAAAGCVKLIYEVGRGVASLRSMIQGIQRVDSIVAGFRGELDALDALSYALAVLSTEIGSSKGTLPAAVSKWWRTASLERILESTVKTLNCLRIIFGEMSKKRRMLEKTRRY